MSNLKSTFDVLVIVNTIGAVASWLPPIAALVSFLWICARLYEMVTGKFFHESKVALWLVRRF